MPVSRRTALKTMGVAGGLSVASGTVFAKGEHADDERPMDDEKQPDDEKPHDEPADVTSAVRVAHFSPDAPNVDILVDGEQVLSDVPYSAVSPYLELEPGTYTVTITAAGDPEAVVFEDEVEVGEAFYTIAAIGELEAETFRPEILVDADPLPEAEPDSAFVRVAHFSPDAPAVDIYANDDPLVEDVSFEDVSDYLAVPAGTYTLSIRPAGDPETEVATFDVTLEAGTPYTGYAIGYLEPPEEFAEREFTVELTVDGPMADEEDEPVDEKDEKPVDEKDEKPVDEKDEKDEPPADDEKPVADEKEKPAADGKEKPEADHQC
ncbi:hypothetical protein CV102_04115 [Natronococcus pandeyae]|uniref:DUF4397 domain-containing protein n=1 Tax=Natronococcus pandeyae TaxID=2055836 RepID=A0A8J8TT51_9EURY|nr:DUF4397 domain-containing protein [Natronococcus pandeyae]TYL39489.1 hypothetical protein CV102_04115 [Natronococcus pandeyae]